MKMVMGIFDVHINSGYGWRGGRAIKMDAHMVLRREDGEYKTDIDEPMASLVIPAGPFAIVDEWIDTKETEKIKELPPFVWYAYSAVVDAARAAQRVYPIDVI